MLDKERHLLFSLNAIDEMQDKFGGFDRLDTVLSGKDSIKNGVLFQNLRMPPERAEIAMPTGMLS